MIAMTTMTPITTIPNTNTAFPYGTFPTDEVFRAHYHADYSKALAHPLPDVLPHHHPLLQRLEGTYPLYDSPAPWWPACLAEIDPALRTILSTTSAQEFRDGCIEQSRWKQFRQALSEHERDMLPSSPKLAPMLENTDWSYTFTQRGAKDTPAQLDMLLSASPLHALYMSNGPDWKSCQHFRKGEYNDCLVGNFYDTGIATVMALAPQTSVWESGAVLARTTIRVLLYHGSYWIGIGQTYHNNHTLAFLLLRQLAEVLDEQQLSWGFLVDVNSLSYCKRGDLGSELQQRISGVEQTSMKSEPFWLPTNWALPYVDAGEHMWDIPNVASHQLRATLQVIKPHTVSACAD